MKKVLLSLQNSETEPHVKWMLGLLVMASLVFENNTTVSTIIFASFILLMIVYSYFAGYTPLHNRPDLLDLFFFIMALMASIGFVGNLFKQIFFYQHFGIFFSMEEIDSIDPEVSKKGDLLMLSVTIFWIILVLVLISIGRKTAQNQIKKSPEDG